MMGLVQPKDINSISSQEQSGLYFDKEMIDKWIIKSKWSREQLLAEIEKIRLLNAKALPINDVRILENVSVDNGNQLLWYRGNLNILDSKCISVVGTRNPSIEGEKRAKLVVKHLVKENYAIVSGLAKGIDSVSHIEALNQNGNVIAVLGTPIHRVYPASNAKLAEQIVKVGLIISISLPFEQKGNWLFPRRNKLMAQISEATIIIEAGSTSGVVHQAAECLRKGKKLLLLNSLVERGDLPWVDGFIKSGAIVVENPDHMLQVLK